MYTFAIWTTIVNVFIILLPPFILVHFQSITEGGPNRGYCIPCDRYYGNLYLHNEDKHNANKQPIPCPFCPKTFASKNSMRSHKSMKHRTHDGPGFCPHCEKHFSKLSNHMEDKHFPKETPCTECNKIFSSMNKMRTHRSMTHRSK